MQLGNKTLTLPLIQGGMGIGISLSNLAGNVAKQGAMGVISAANCGYNNPNFAKDPNKANFEALEQEIKKAKKISEGHGIVGVNVMVAASDYSVMVKTAIKSGADAIISGAGLPLTLPEIAGDSKVLLAPVISSGRAAALICRTWQKRYNRLPDFFVLEGSEAGGHLGFSLQELENDGAKPLDILFEETKQALSVFGEIPIFVAGSIKNAEELYCWTQKGAMGVQIATPFIATHECDASLEYKNVIINAKQEDIIITKSPVGMPARAIISPLTQLVQDGKRMPPKKCNRCIGACDPAQTPYCITQALIDAVKGNWETGLFFCGANTAQVTQLKTVKQVIDEFTSVWREK